MIGTGDGWASRHGTWPDALHHLREAIEHAGILVAINSVVGNDTHRKLDTEEFRGFVLTDKYAPLIFVNGSDAKSAQMFTLAHELAHLWVGESALFNLQNMAPSGFAVEQFCNKVAAEFLVPAAEFESYWPQAIQDADPFQVIARHFKVSPIVAARRAQDLGLIQQAEFLTFYRTYQEDERRQVARTAGGGGFLPEPECTAGQTLCVCRRPSCQRRTLALSRCVSPDGFTWRNFRQVCQGTGCKLTMTVKIQYLLDANVLMEAKRRYYRFGLCPGFRECIAWQHKQGALLSIDRIRKEIDQGTDDLTEWVKRPHPRASLPTPPLA